LLFFVLVLVVEGIYLRKYNQSPFVGSIVHEVDMNTLIFL